MMNTCQCELLAN